MNPHVEVLADLPTLIDRALDLVLEKLQSSIASRNIATIALAGGSTPKPLYEKLAQQNLPWDKLHIFWGDERYVPADHPDSNQRMARLAWLDRVPIPPENIHPMPTDDGDPAISAQKHEAELQSFFKSEPGEFPAFDVILLGIGDDAHTASLFPHTEALQVCDRFITVGDKDGNPRITFTVPLINTAHAVIFLVAGANKYHALTQIFADEADTETYPARLINPQGELWWLLERSTNFAK
ncbi:6-phosphogluconolactonase [Leptolyngbya sp. NIES-2104]|uniref:6-phosphogluconolactonase n=1 Tax=Leptolyngbya sp. NIES-2104 TaxID=1552121 RepID=UPI0006ECA85B|nr:6-phosphogluconolactonase [Leptolyngbya sp. NIES-2104]GAP98605.1 6-phosphogluconolactonase, eukaryotic type [Leptolyngbya sp. NIES-2104]